MASNFFEQDIPHGLVKRFMYKRYLQAYIPITQSVSFWKTVITDGFAGPGRYGDDWPPEIEKYGSPVIALRVAIEYCNDRKVKGKEGDVDRAFNPTLVRLRTYEEISECANVGLRAVDHATIILVFIEKARKHFYALLANIFNIFLCYGITPTLTIDTRHNVEHIVFTTTSADHDIFPIRCELIRRSFDQYQPPDSNPNCRYLTLIDPFGYSQTPMASVQKFVGPYHEVFINFMSSYVNRFLSQNPEAVAELFGLGIPEETKDVAKFVSKAVLNEEADVPRDKLNRIVKNYEGRLRNHLGAEYVLTFEMRQKNNARLYHMIFVTNHIKGLETMKKTMVFANQHQAAMSDANPFTMSDFKIMRKSIPMSLNNDQDNQQIATEIFRQFQGRDNVRVTEVENYVLLETPFIAQKKQLKLLEEEGRITHVSSTSETSRKRVRGTYPGWAEWRLTFA